MTMMTTIRWQFLFLTIIVTRMDGGDDNDDDDDWRLYEQK